MVCLRCILQVILLASATAKISYFWHITDIHLDVDYSVKGDPRRNCWRTEQSVNHETVGRYGNYNCDSPWALVQSAARTMKTKNGEDIEFVLWTGDGLSVMSSSRSSEKQVAALQNLTHLFSHTFPSQFVFPVLGHDDPGGNPGERLGYRELANFWRHWLPSEAIATFVKGGYYTIEHKDNKLRIIALNTNLYSSPHSKGDDPSEQFSWLAEVLEKSQKFREKVYIVGHMGPGPDERQPDTMPHFREAAARRYLGLIRKYSDIIVGQFFGHLHSDTFRIVYNGSSARPVSWMLMAPSLSPRRTNGGANNPGLRLYKFNRDTAQVLDYTQYYLDLNQANQKEKADWSQEYNFTSYYGLTNITPSSLHELASSFRHDSPSFDRYYRANSVGLSMGHCDGPCTLTHYCATTRVEYSEFRHCLDAAASALASGSTAITAGLFVVLALGLPSLVT
ncbi:acid sphingomyelinase-like phosphodiesterase 3b [Homalodisca vitripennis]|uniref:acid sphingomyelinase-like phosphodiesterase 3b n=1 Tax=Homalodisca vitripennis TaxID=197043 RepID=UPI001EEC2C60|nr:acid sphingomyelinase-like phosphodiesterase 3b [Homalodisca vitripennis]XP_046667204.1 acid sphingomyelinase-like phosphodiesterase 3b [Homalodisca vitripennis]